MASNYSVCFVTTPPGIKGKTIARKIVRQRLAACVNVVPLVKSVYWWKGTCEEAGESLLIIKTRVVLKQKLMTYIRSIHPYTVPEIIFLPIAAGHQPYLNWISKETRG